MDGKILSLFRKGSLLRQMYYGGYEDFDGANGGVWKKYINIPIKTVPLEYAQYLIEIDDTNVSVYNVERTLKAQSSIASEFWSLVRSDGFDIRAFDHLFNQLWFWVEMFDYTNKKAKIWVRLPENSEELNIAFGNEKAYESSYNNRDNTFEFFDDFDTKKPEWSLNYATIDTTNSRLDIHPGAVGSDIERGAWLNKVLTRNRVIEFKASFQGKYTNPRPVWSVNWIDSSNYYAIGEFGLYRPSSSHVRVVIGGSSRTFGFTSKSLSENTYYIFKIAWSKSNGNVKYWVDSDLLADVTDGSLKQLDASGLALTAKDLNHVYVDWIRVLKFADPATFDTPRILEF